MISYRIVIVNWNSGDQVRSCLQSINEIDVQGFVLDKVVVVDNASIDNSQKTDNKYNFNFEIIQNQENMGFAFACNQGAEGCVSDYILFLNPDTLLFKNTMVNLSSFLASKDSSIGIVGIQLIDENGKIARTCARFLTKRQKLCKILGVTILKPSTSCIMEEWPHDESRVVDHVMGAFYVVECTLFKKINGFDEDYFVYYEDVDFSKRAFDTGLKAYFFTGAKAFHKGGGTSEQVLDKRLFYSQASFLEYQKKHHGFIAMYIAFMLELFEYFSRLFIMLCSRKKNGIKDLNSAYRLLINDFVKNKSK